MSRSSQVKGRSIARRGNSQHRQSKWKHQKDCDWQDDIKAQYCNCCQKNPPHNPASVSVCRRYRCWECRVIHHKKWLQLPGYKGGVLGYGNIRHLIRHSPNSWEKWAWLELLAGSSYKYQKKWIVFFYLKHEAERRRLLRNSMEVYEEIRSSLSRN